MSRMHSLQPSTSGPQAAATPSHMQQPDEHSVRLCSHALQGALSCCCGQCVQWGQAVWAIDCLCYAKFRKQALNALSEI